MKLLIIHQMLKEDATGKTLLTKVLSKLHLYNLIIFF